MRAFMLAGAPTSIRKRSQLNSGHSQHTEILGYDTLRTVLNPTSVEERGPATIPGLVVSISSWQGDDAYRCRILQQSKCEVTILNRAIFAKTVKDFEGMTPKEINAANLER
jgi:hypothetical protein